MTSYMIAYMTPTSTPNDLLNRYPTLEKQDIQAALLYAADTMAEKLIGLPTGT